MFGVDDSFFFSNPPSKKDCKKALLRNKGLAEEVYAKFYDTVIDSLDQCFKEARPTHESRLCGSGGPLPNGGSFGFDRFDLIRNEMEPLQRS